MVVRLRPSRAGWIAFKTGLMPRPCKLRQNSKRRHMPLRFRNIDATPDDPVSRWGVEGMSAALDRGYAQHWSRMAQAIADDPALE